MVTLANLTALAQETPVVSADDTGRTIALVIGTLLGLALLLAVLTFWYWRRTDPRKRAGAVQQPASQSPARPVTARPASGPGTGPVSPRGAGSGTTGSGSATGTAADRGITADEWLRLTGSRQPGTGQRP
jgi:hypothetical protein